MKATRKESRKKLFVCGGAALFLLPLLVLAVLKTDSVPQLARLRVAGITQVSDFFFSIQPSSGQVALSENDGETISNQLQYPAGPTKEAVVHSVTQVSSSDDDHVAAPRSSKLSCHVTIARMDICAMEGHVRVHGRSASVYVVAPSNGSYRPENGTLRIRPYARQLDSSTMVSIVTTTGDEDEDDAAQPPAPRCTVTHHVPAVVFSTTGPYSNNFFHLTDDTIIPLFNTAREYGGQVQLLATDYDHMLIFKLRHLLAALSVYPVIDLDADDAVRCFPLVRVGLERHDELRINPALSRKGYTMADFRAFLRSAYSLKHASAANQGSGQRPRLLLVLRRRSRVITNEAEAIAAATEVGFEVVAAGPEMVRHDMATFAEVVNSCSVMVGVHGAGLTNAVFLPDGGTMVQILPWGEMKEIGLRNFGLPAQDMGLRYMDYEVTADETTLKEVYPRDHAVFSDPASIHKLGFHEMWEIFLDGQNITLDIHRFRGVMHHIYQSAGAAVTIT